MANANEVYEAMGILLPKVPRAECWLCAEHDEIYLCGPPPLDLTQPERLRLVELGATYDPANASWKIGV